MGCHCFGINIWLEILFLPSPMRTNTYIMGPVSESFHSSTVETHSTDTRLIQTPIHNGSFICPNTEASHNNFSKNSLLSIDTWIIQALFHIIPLVSALTRFHCTCNKINILLGQKGTHTAVHKEQGTKNLVVQLALKVGTHQATSCRNMSRRHNWQ